MKILAIEKELGTVNWSFENETLVKEAQCVYQLYLIGYLREIYFNQDHCAVLILECESLEKAKEILQPLPLVEKGLIEFEMMQLNPYSGYDRIIK